MRYEQIRTVEDGLVYITDCTLATVEYMASLKSRTKHEYHQQIAIAQKALDILRSHSVVIPSGERAATVIADFHGDVTSWAKRYEA